MSALSPTVELGAQWPPMGISPVNPFELPLLNTVLLLSSGTTVTYAHHSLIQGNRAGALYGLIATLVLAVAFTILQGVEYSVSSFTISDGAFGSCFYFGTGFHGLTHIAPTNFIIISSIKNIVPSSYYANKIHVNTFKKFSSLAATADDDLDNNKKKDKLWIKLKNKTYSLDKNFLQWFAGFTDAEGNFNISLRNFKDNKYNSLILTFQIGLHIDDLDLLKFIQKKLNCGHISVSGSRCNYFVNDQASLIHVILPIFNYVQLNSSKYFYYLIFEKAVNLIKNKDHLSPKGKLEIIKHYHEIKNVNLTTRSKDDFHISDYWLGGFIDGDGSFSTNKHVPRLKLENHVKELELFHKIKEYFNAGNLIITSPRKRGLISNPTVVLSLNNIHVLKNVIIPLFSENSSKFRLLQSKKFKDFCDWSILVNIYFYGYHILPEGISLINDIKARMNNFRLTSNKSSINIVGLDNTVSSLDSKISYLFSLPTPYEIKNGVRYLTGTNKLVSEKLRIIAIDENDHKFSYSSISECHRALKIGRLIIKNCILTGKTYKGYKFIYAV